jgi:ribonuclease D
MKQFEPITNIYTLLTQNELYSAMCYLEQFPVIGFDTESKPTFVKGQKSDGPHVIQLSTAEKAFIIQPCRFYDIAPVQHLLQFSDTLKVGFGLWQDKKFLNKKFDIVLTRTLDLNSCLKTIFQTPQDIGMERAIQMTLNKIYKKTGIKKSDWSRKVLTPTQKLYAANDAYASLLVFNALPYIPKEVLQSIKNNGKKARY